ncbi:MAG: hypothetical protein K9M96_11735 [Deltaproteobacteria bacterium]|nr:hypothetical protein [Deltaproteobacteria bacterium]
MSLQQKIDAKKQEFQASAPQENQDIMGRAVKALIQSGAVDRALKEGDTAPDFTLNNAEGQSSNLDSVLIHKLVVLGFYRGRW